jgi:hypothetical protein
MISAWVADNDVGLFRCGKILLSNAARFSLHTLRSFPGLFALVHEMPELQKIVHTKRRSASGDVIEGILRHQIRHVAQKRLECAGLVVVEDPILTPVKFPRHQLVLSATEWVKWMDYAEPACGGSHTICIR